MEQVDRSEDVSNAESRSSVQLDEGSGGLDPNYNIELYRLLSFPNHLEYSVASHLAKLGFHFIPENSAQCQFCPSRFDALTPDLVNEEHACARSGNIELREDTIDYNYESNRLLSFLSQNWPKKADDRKPVGALDLAHWGFFYTGTSDAVRCTFCRIGIQGWILGDTAHGEHRRWNPLCPLLEERGVGNITLLQEYSVENAQSDASAGLVQRRHVTDTASSNVELSIFLQTPAKHPEYTNLIARLESFKTWPLSMTQRPQQLADAGFFYTGKGDRVICFQCGCGLKDWGRTDQPWIEHAVWSKKCTYLILKKGHNFIDHIQYLKQQASNASSDTSVEPSLCNVGGSTRETDNHGTATSPAQAVVQPQTTEIPSERRCKICLEKELGIVFLPCGHMAACVDCAPQMTTCPMCRGNLSAYVRGFLP